ncbi:MAG: phenylalanine--tRNA ligase subunit beta, partial [Bacteroidota bacterium]|nr:phenylalanine--tRNA ligase subunit beta [Bacteroidota bacterium]
IRPADVVEEILRIYGYNNIDFSDQLIISMPKGYKAADAIERIIGQQLANLGFFEIYNNSLVKLNESEADKTITIVNPLSQDLTAMRTNLFEGLVASMQYNINRKNENCKFFEFGNTYHKEVDENVETKQLVIGVTGGQNENHWRNNGLRNDFFFIKGVIQAICKRAGIESTEHELTNQKHFKNGITLMSKNAVFAHLGQLELSTFSDITIENEVYGAEIDIEAFQKVALLNAKHIKSISKFPSVKRDLALLVDNHVSFASLRNVAQETEKKLLTSIQLFDVYEGKGIPKGKTSYGLSFTFNDSRKTLTDKQIDKSINKIFERMQKEFGAELRA